MKKNESRYKLLTKRTLATITEVIDRTTGKVVAKGETYLSPVDEDDPKVGKAIATGRAFEDFVGKGLPRWEDNVAVGTGYATSPGGPYDKTGSLRSSPFYDSTHIQEALTFHYPQTVGYMSSAQALSNPLSLGPRASQDASTALSPSLTTSPTSAKPREAIVERLGDHTWITYNGNQYGVGYGPSSWVNAKSVLRFATGNMIETLLPDNEGYTRELNELYTSGSFPHVLDRQVVA